MLLVFILSFCLCATSSSQLFNESVTSDKKSITKAVLKGKAYDIWGKAVAGAKVTLGKDSAFTDPPGTFRLVIPVPDSGGTFLSEVKDGSYRPKSALVKLVPGDTTVYNFILVPTQSKAQLGVCFKSKSTKIVNPGYIDNVASFLKDCPELSVEVQGHCFDWKSKQRNFRTSQSRADIVRREIIKKGGIDSTRIVAKGYGSSIPVLGEMRMLYASRIELLFLP